MKKPDTYKTNHPTITEITIGDQFVTNDGTIVTFVAYRNHYNLYPFHMVYDFYCTFLYTKNLKYYANSKSQYDIKNKYIPLKEKIDLL